MPWLSVIVPIYNAERYLNQCISSILSQTFRDYEVILIDDGSNDKSSQICTNYASIDKRVRYFRKSNEGSLKARLDGIKRARGEYITFCDADDYYISRRAFSIIHSKASVERCSVLQFGILKRYNHLMRRVSHVKDCYIENRESFLLREYPKFLCSFWDEAIITISIWNKIYHKSLFKALPEPEKLGRTFWGDDLILNLHLMEHVDSVVYIPNCLYVYRATVGNTKKFSPNAMYDLDVIKQFQLLFLEKHDRPDSPKILQVLFSEVAGWFYYHIQDAIKNMNENDVISLISETLSYKTFILAREYFMKHRELQSTPIELLRNGNPQEYISICKNVRSRITLKSIIVNILKRI